MKTGRDASLILFGRRVREIRKAKGISQEELARMCDYNTSMISKIENGLADLPVSKVKLLASCLRVSPLDLIEEYLEAKETEPGEIFKALPKEKQDEIMRAIEQKLLLEGVSTWGAHTGTRKEEDGDSVSARTEK